MQKIQSQEIQGDQSQELSTATVEKLATVEATDGVAGLAVHELIYCENGTDYDAYIALIKLQWPQAVFEDGSDDIHDHRFAVTIAGVEQDDFFRFAMKNRLAMCCLGFNLAMIEDAPRILQLWKSLNVPEAGRGELARLS